MAFFKGWVWRNITWQWFPFNSICVFDGKCILVLTINFSNILSKERLVCNSHTIWWLNVRPHPLDKISPSRRLRMNKKRIIDKCKPNKCIYKFIIFQGHILAQWVTKSVFLCKRRKINKIKNALFADHVIASLDSLQLIGCDTQSLNTSEWLLHRTLFNKGYSNMLGTSL